MITRHISNLNFSQKAYSANGNEYRKSYVGRIIGTGAGIGLAIGSLRVKKGVGKFGKLAQKYKGMVNRAIDYISKDNSAMETALKQIITDSKQILNSTKLRAVVKYATPIAAAWFVVGGYIKGAIADNLINKRRAQKADKFYMI